MSGRSFDGRSCRAWTAGGGPLAVALCLLLSGCDSTSTTSQDAGTPPDGSVTVGKNAGFITLVSNQKPAGTRANAVFLPGGPAYDCPEQAVGAHCVFYRCTKRTPADGLPAPSAGEITVTGGASPLVFSPMGDGTYDTVVRTTSLWSGGEALSVNAAGADVPAFSGTWSAPRRATLTTPATLADPWPIPRSADLVLAWTGGTDEEIVATFGTTSTTAPTEVECVFPASAKTGTVPSGALTMLPAGDAYYSVSSRVRKTVTAGPWSVLLRAESDVVLADEAGVFGGATLQ